MDLKRIEEYMKRVELSETKTGTPVSDKLKVGVDLGTAFIVLVVLDEENNPIACEKQQAKVLRDGVVVDYQGASRIVRELKEKLESRLDRELDKYRKLVDSEYFSGYGYTADQKGVVVDIGGGTTGLAIVQDGKVVRIEDEPTGGTHLSLVLAGNYHISFDEAEKIKQDYSRHKEILPIVRPVVQKMATIVKRNLASEEVDTIYLCGGTCCLTGIEEIIEKETGIRTIKPANPFLVTPTGIAMNCIV